MSTKKKKTKRKEQPESTPKQAVKKNIDDAVFKDAVDDFDKFESFFLANFRKIIIGSVVVVVAFIIGYLIYLQVQALRTKASEVLTAAKTVDELNNALKKYPDSKTCNSARLTLGRMYFNDGKYKEALNVFRKIAESAETDFVVYRGKLNVAYTLEALKKFESAADNFSRTGLDASAPAYIRNEANYSAARIFLKLNKKESAKSCLRSVKSEKSAGFWSAQAERLLQRIEADDQRLLVKSSKKFIRKPKKTLKPVLSDTSRKATQ